MNTEFFYHRTLTHLNAGAQKNTVFGPERIEKKRLDAIVFGA